MIGVSNVVVSYTINLCTLLIQRLLVPDFEYDYIVANIMAFLLAVLWSFIWSSQKVFSVNN
ncbi:GtrA family protein [Pseudobutyrivibrio xylanivorans]|uniref:GtrA family protein n=1 Tax=Pseudobutyrivibrio xylanivorans TaxID=185007 RepID=UPI0009351E9D